MATAAAAAITDPQIFPHHMTVQSPIRTWNIPMPPSKMKTKANILEDQISNQYIRKENNRFQSIKKQFIIGMSELYHRRMELPMYFIKSERLMYTRKQS